MEDYLDGNVICLTGFVRPMFSDDGGDGDEDEDELSVAGVIYLSTEQVVDIDAQYQDGQVSLWVATPSAWYLLGAPRPNYIGLCSSWLLLHYATAHIVHVVSAESAAGVPWAEQSSYDAALETFKVPAALAQHIDRDMVPHIFDLNFGAIVANLVDFHDPTSFIFKHKIPKDLKISKSKGAKHKDAPVPKLNKSKTNKQAAPPIGPSVLTPRVDAIRRELRVFEEGVARFGSGEYFVYPPAHEPVAAAGAVTAKQQNMDEFAVGDVVQTTHGSLYVVQDVDGDRAHLVKVVEGKETFVGAFAEEGVCFAVPSCTRRSFKHLTKTAIRVNTLFTGKSYVTLNLDEHCPSCGPDRNAIQSEGFLALDEPPADMEHPLLHVDDWDNLWPAIDSDASSKVLVGKEWVCEGDFVYFSLAPKVNSEAPSITKKRPKEMALYAIGQVEALVEAPPPGPSGHLPESDDEVEEKSKANEPRAKTLRHPKYVNARVSLLGRWDSLWHASRESGRHPRRLFYTDAIITIPATAILGTLCIVPLQHARNDFFAFPKNFVLVGAHSHHDPRRYLSVHHHIPTKQTPDNDAADLEIFDNPATLVNGSVANIRHINQQLKAVLFERGYAVHVPTAPAYTPNAAEDTPADPPVNKLCKLRALDLFSGCGGLTVGFDNDALASCDTRWAVEMDPGAVETFRHNFPDATVYDEDANGVLRAAIEQRMTGTTASRSRKLPPVPKVGEVEMIYAGPPCQGFSDLNAAPKSNDAKNTLIPVTLSYVELFRPKAFLLENVTGMLTYRLGGQQKGRHAVSGGFKGGVPRFIVRVLLSLGYQVTWLVAQAGNVGVPQSRRRLIVLATLPHVKLPEWPEATHLTSLERETMHVRDEHAELGSKEQGAAWAQKVVFCNEMRALFPPSTVGDIIDDLPPYDWRNPNRVMGLSMREVEALRADPSIPEVDAEHPDGKRVCVSCGMDDPQYASAPRSELQRWLRGSRAGDWLGVEGSADAPTAEELAEKERRRWHNRC
ncbi:hypothetical protein BCR44DRAFT_1146818 [Catenaria anguillulae PL171]|uniref:DNA (cytosine-5-)-methyltransferase n=1 Tax=Catenaria anguillulae PL171 TaxID=765915 RepID=A0A1Y2HIU7_9FUNG|nr:hypothetical protein BCR44DRAFT_1146818 [Catenaria anguillulae PL171]